jgi:MSHA biogenesis protein MshE
MGGYQGRTGVYEFLEMTNEIVDAINDGDPNKYVQVARQQMIGNTLRADALRLVLAGRTTLDEAMRITGQSDD